MTREEKYWITHKLINDIIYKKCSKHDKWFPDEDPWFPETIDYFYLHNKSKPENGFQSECKICSTKRSCKNQADNIDRRHNWFYRYYHSRIEEEAIRHKNWRNKNREHIKEYTDDYMKKNPDKAQKYGEDRQHKNHDITDTEWENVLKIFNYRCAYCGKTLEEQLKENGEQFHKEHVWFYGANDIRNCVPACTNCNSKKWAFTLYEWYNPNNLDFTFERLDLIIWWCLEGYKEYIEDKPPYRIIRKQNDNNKNYHHELWTVDPERRLLQCVGKATKKKDLDEYIKILSELIK